MASETPPTPSCEPFSGSVVLLPGGSVVLVGAQARLDVLRALQLSGELARRDGIGNAARVVDLMRLLATSLSSPTSTSAAASAEVPPQPVPAVSRTWIDAKDAAALLGVTPRQARNRAEELGARKSGVRWLFDRDALEELLAARRERGNAA